MALSGCRPRLFVYDLPARYRDEGRSGGYGRLVQYEQGVLPPNLRLYAAKTYGTGSVVYTRAMHHACLAKAYSAKGEWRPYVARAFAGAAALDAPPPDEARDKPLWLWLRVSRGGGVRKAPAAVKSATAQRCRLRGCTMVVQAAAAHWGLLRPQQSWVLLQTCRGS